jgi:hypothetical protein
MNILNNIFSSLLIGFVLLTSAGIANAETKSLCVFDMLGANGPYFAEMKD